MSVIPVAELPTQVSDRRQSWRLAHDGVKVIAKFETSGETWTIGNLFCATEEKEIDDEIKRLGLKELPAKEMSGFLEAIVRAAVEQDEDEVR